MADDAPRQEGTPPDPSGIEGPHDVLAAEEHAMPTPEPGQIPGDAAGIREPHDVLAAEEFAMPAGGAASPPRSPGPMEPRSYVPLALLAIALLVILRRRAR